MREAPSPTMRQYRELRARGRATFARFVDALNRRDDLDDLLHRPRHPLPPDRAAYLEDRLAEARRTVAHLESELTRYEDRLQRLARALGADAGEE